MLLLVAGAAGGLCRLACLRTDLVEGKVAEGIAQLAGFDIFLLQCRQHGLDELSAEGALVVGELDESERRVLLSQRGIASLAASWRLEPTKAQRKRGRRWVYRSPVDKRIPVRALMIVFPDKMLAPR